MRFAILLLATFGAADSLFLLYSNVFCLGVCRLQVLPFPTWIVCAAAIVWFSLAAALEKLPKRLVKVWAAVGIVGIAFLVSYSLMKGYYCPYCYAAHAAGVATIALGVRTSSSNSSASSADLKQSSEKHDNMKGLEELRF